MTSDLICWAVGAPAAGASKKSGAQVLPLPLIGSTAAAMPGKSTAIVMNIPSAWL